MFTSIILTVGIVAIILTGVSWYRNLEFMKLRIKKGDLTPSDKFIDFPIRLVWLLYITLLSFGFIINNLF